MKKSIFLLLLTLTMYSCQQNIPQAQAQSDSGVTKATVKIKTDSEGHNVEQANYMEGTKRDNETGSVKHLYIISSYSGDVLEYSTVRGKVTSGGKRLSPKTVIGDGSIPSDNENNSNIVRVGNRNHLTNEFMDEYGMYGDSMPYVYWFDSQDNYHQYFPSGGTFLHISDKPLRVRKANLSVSFD